MSAILIITSVSAIVTQNCLFNRTCKTALKTRSHINLFNLFAYSVCVLIFGALAISGGISLFTALLGLIFGVVTALSNLYKMLALSSGPMHITLLVTTSSMIIPTLSGIFFGEKFSPLKLCVVFILIAFIYLSMQKSKGSKIQAQWILYCALAFLFQGSVGVLQKLHQTSEYKSEVSGLLLISFLCAVIFCIIRNRGFNKSIKLDKKTVLIGLICGVCTFLMNYINLKLSGMLPSQLFFPLVNGSAIILSSVMSIIFFKETLSKKQLIGLIGGIMSLIAICLVP